MLTLPSKPTNNAKNYGYKKETIKTVTIWDIRTRREAVAARWYMSRSASGASPVYCSVWFGQFSGSGTAGGYGYHKTSAAFEAALLNAGVTLDKPCSGRGDAAIETAMKELALALGHGASRLLVTL